MLFNSDRIDSPFELSLLISAPLLNKNSIMWMPSFNESSDSVFFPSINNK